MEFPFETTRLFNLDEDGITVLSGKDFSSYSGVTVSNKYGPRGTANSKPAGSTMDQIALIIDRMGDASSKAQQLPQTITTMSRFAGTNQRLYLKVEKNTVQGLLKVGERTIFYRDFTGKCKELNPVCVLDFYVHESLQRMGIGNLLFTNMLKHERVLPNKIAYDRPSSKLLKFLAKHYDLVSYVPQNNNFVIYEAYWKVGVANPELRDPRESAQSRPQARASGGNLRAAARGGKGGRENWQLRREDGAPGHSEKDPASFELPMDS